MAEIIRYDPTGPTRAEDTLVPEEPLEIRVGDKPVSITLRTPGEDFELAAGFLFSESILGNRGDIASIRHWGSPNVVRVDVAENVKLDLQRLQRHFYATSSCGVCGKTSIDALRVHSQPLTGDTRVRRETIHALADAVREQQKTFATTGAIHAAGIFDANGALLITREDVGRHNAVDKAIGRFFLDGQRLDHHVLFASGRTSFEIVQKAIIARIPVIAAVGAPSTLAVDLARDFNVTLLGFVRDGRFNVYSHEQRIT